MNNLMKYKVKLWKVSIGSFLAFVVASFLQLDYAISTPIITILTIQNTKRETLQVALKRILSFLIAILLAYIIFFFLSHNVLSFGVFILCFYALCLLFQVEDGFISSTVLITHIYSANSLKTSIIVNEFLILIIGMSIGIGLNLFFKNKESIIKENQRKIEELLSVLLHDIANILFHKVDAYNEHKHQLLTLLQTTRRQTIENQNNVLISSTTYYLDYVSMRVSQVDLLEQVYTTLHTITITNENALKIAAYVEQVAESIHEYNNAKILLDQLQDLYLEFSQKELPTTRSEFEERAILFSVLLQLQNFLTLKSQFVDNHEEEMKEISYQDNLNK